MKNYTPPPLYETKLVHVNNIMLMLLKENVFAYEHYRGKTRVFSI